ncbi:MAG: DUF1385 domain-containing protein [Lachnospiraceae bacterium]|nr:DUF1385 domain-containing protein [Lachnospiraceae bacterium]
MANKGKKRRACFSGIGGQAVLEGIMMKNKDKYAVAVRKPNGEIEVDIDEFQGIAKGSIFKQLPFFRGVFNFIDSLTLGMKSINYSASFYEEEADKETRVDKALNKIFKDKAERVLTGFVTFISVCLAIAMFILLPYYLTAYFTKDFRNETYVALIEGLIRVAVFILYVVGISFNKDIKRVYKYHGAEHKCINCIEHGHELTVENVLRSSRLHKRCGTSFMLLVVLISIILFFFIRVESPIERVVIRLLLIPVIAGIAYEFIRLAGRSNNVFVKIISASGMLLQKITTKEPDSQMVEVAIAAVEAVFDWKDFLTEKFPGKVSDDIKTDEDSENNTEANVTGDSEETEV